MPDNRKDLGLRGQDLKKAADALASSVQALGKLAAGLPDPGKSGERLDQVQAQYAVHLAASARLAAEMDSLLQAAGRSPSSPAAPETGNFVDFLTSVGGAVLEAQRDLDARSRAYIGDTAHADFVLPTAFRIPKLTGKMLFQLEFEKQKGIQLVFHSDTEKATRLNQQSIEFDIVSVPAPLDAAGALRAASPAVTLVLDGAARRRFLEAAGAAAGEDSVPAAVLADALRIVLLEIREGPAEPAYLALYADQSGKPSAVGVWSYAAGSIQVLYKLTRQNGPFEDRFKSLVSALAGAQAAFLSPAGA